MLCRLLTVLLCGVALLSASERAPLRSSWRTAHFELAAPGALAPEVPRLAALSELVYDSLSRFYGYELPKDERFRLVLLDEDDYSNGFAIGFAGWVAVYLSPGDFQLRGSPGWHANVLAHEISHLVTLRKLGYTSSYLGHMLAGGVLRERGSVQAQAGPYPHDLESWLAEGLAQLGAEACGLDRWDAVRDGLEREAYFLGELPPLSALKTFHQDSRRAELLYNQGYSFMRWVRSNLDSAQWRGLLDQAAPQSLQASIAGAFHQDFSEVFRLWRVSRELRHETAAQVAQAWQAPVASQAPTEHYRVQGKRVHTLAGEWVLDSKPNDQGALRLYGPDQAMVERSPSGSLWADAAGERLVYGSSQLTMSNLHENSLWEAQAPAWTPKRIPGSARVVAGCYAGDSLWVIRHRDGRNRVGILAAGQVRELGGMPGALEPLELACGSREQVVVSATHGSGRRLYRVSRQGEGMAWTLLAGQGTEDTRNPVVVRDSVYFASDRHGAFQIYRMPVQGTPESAQQLTLERGGAFQPSCAGDTLHYSALRLGSFVSVALAAPPTLPPQALAPAELPLAAPMQVLRPAALSQSMEAADRVSWLGWYTATQMVYGARDLVDTNGNAGRVLNWLALAGALVSDPALQNNAEFLFGVLGFQGSEAYANPGYMMGASWNLQTFAPDISLQAQFVMQPLAPHGGSLFPDSVSDELSEQPWVNYLSMQASLGQPLTERWSALAQLQYFSFGISDEKATDGQSIAMREQAQGLALLAWQSVESGRRHPNSGVVWYGGGGVQWMGIVPTYTGISVTMPLLVSQATLYGNLGRSLYLSMGGDVSAVQVPKDEDLGDSAGVGWHASGALQGSLDLPLPWSPASWRPSASHSQTWTALEFHLGYGVRWTDSLMYSGTSGWSESAVGKLNIRETPRALTAQDVLGSGVLEQNVEAALRWETLTFANGLGMWELGVRFPPSEPRDWTLFVGIQL